MITDSVDQEAALEVAYKKTNPKCLLISTARSEIAEPCGQRQARIFRLVLAWYVVVVVGAL